MSEPAPELDPEDALHGVVNQLVINGRRIPFIVPGSVIEIMPVLAELLRNAQARGSLSLLLPKVMPWVRSLPEADLSTFASDLADAAASGDHAPERLAARLREWQATAEVYADPDEAERLRRAMREAEDGRAEPWQFDEASA